MSAGTKQIEAVHQALGARIRLIRETLGISQQEMGTRTGQTRMSVNNIEQGRQRFILHHVETFARALGTTPKHLLKGIWW